MRRALSAALLFVPSIILLSSHCLSAQTLTTATIVGTVVDSSGAVLPGTAITVKQRETGEVHTTRTGTAGDYRVPFLKPGDYVVTAEGNGLTANPISVQLSVGREQAIRFVLGVQAVSQSVDVEAASELLQTENGNSVSNYTQQYIENTPVNGGDITNIAFTTPGIRLNVGGGNRLVKYPASVRVPQWVMVGRTAGIARSDRIMRQSSFVTSRRRHGPHVTLAYIGYSSTVPRPAKPRFCYPRKRWRPGGRIARERLRSRL